MNLTDRPAYVLNLLRKEAYGREVIARAKARDNVALSEGTLYPLLRSLEADGLLDMRTSEPMAERGGRRRHYYQITKSGLAALAAYQHEMLARVSRVTGLALDSPAV